MPHSGSVRVNRARFASMFRTVKLIKRSPRPPCLHVQVVPVNDAVARPFYAVFRIICQRTRNPRRVNREPSGGNVAKLKEPRFSRFTRSASRLFRVPDYFPRTFSLFAADPLECHLQDGRSLITPSTFEFRGGSLVSSRA